MLVLYAFSFTGEVYWDLKVSPGPSFLLSVYLSEFWSEFLGLTVSLILGFDSVMQVMQAK